MAAPVFTAPSGHTVATVDDARQLLGQDINTGNADLRALLLHPTPSLRCLPFTSCETAKRFSPSGAHPALVVRGNAPS